MLINSPDYSVLPAYSVDTGC